jgi:SNF2 family DNA or RNA helicase
MLTLKDMHQYQRNIANTILHNRSTFVCAQMGLGKSAPTFSAIQYLQREKGFGTALVLGPIRVVYNSYPDELDKWQHLKNMGSHILHGPGKKWPVPKTSLILSNYESIPYIIEKKIYKACDILVVDESSKVKSHQTKRFKALKKICGMFKKVVLLTGTPSQSGTLQELWSQVYLLDEGQRLGKTFWQFRNRYYEKADFMGYEYQLRPGAKEQIQNKIKDITIVLKAKDYLNMPPIIRTTIPVSLPVKALQLYQDMEKDFLVEMDQGIITAANAAVKSGKLRQITAGGIYGENGDYTLLHDAKVTALKDLIEETESNIICCYQFRFERSVLSRTFPEARFIDGSTNAADSTRNIKGWNNGKVKLLCCHPASVGHGLNLQAGGHVLVWLSPDWSLERTEQMDARVYRQGQKKKVFIYTIAVRDSIDMAVINALQEKGKGQDGFMNALKQYAIKRKTTQKKCA